MCSTSFFMEIKMYSQRNTVEEMFSQTKKCVAKKIEWEPTKKRLLLEIRASYESLLKRDH